MPEWAKPVVRPVEAASGVFQQAFGNVVGLLPGSVGEAGHEYARAAEPAIEQSPIGETGGTLLLWDTGGKVVDVGVGAVSKIPGLARAAKVFEPEKVIKLDEDFLPKVSKKALARNVARAATKQGIKGGLTGGLVTGDPYVALVTASIGAGLGGTLEATRYPVAARLLRKGRQRYADWLRGSGPKPKKKFGDVLIAGQPWNPSAANMETDAIARGLHYGSEEQALARATRTSDEISEQLDKAYAKLDENSRFKLKPLFDDIWAWMGHNGVFSIDGTVKDEAVFKIGLRIMEELTEKLGPEMAEAPPSKLREMRDLFMKRAKSYTKTPTGISVPTSEAPGLAYERELTHVVENRLRGILNSNSPTLQELNHEYRFWETFREALDAKRIATTGQPIVDTSTTSALAKAGKLLGGAAMGGTAGWEGSKKAGLPIEAQVLSTLVGGIGGAVLSNAITSTRWRTLSPVIYDRVAKLLVRGEGNAASVAAAQALANASKDAAQKGYWLKQAGLAKKYVAQQTLEAKAAKALEEEQNLKAFEQSIAKPKTQPKGTITLGQAGLPKPTPPTVHPADKAWEDLKSQGFEKLGEANVGGMHGGKLFYQDANGNKWLFKPTPTGWSAWASDAEEAAYKIGRKINPNAVEVRSQKLGLKTGTVQKMLPNTGEISNDVTQLTKQQLEQLQQEQVVDWMISNHDSHARQFLKGTDGKLIAIDKGQAFKHFPKDIPDPTYHPNAAYGEDNPIYHYLHKAAKNGQITLDPNVTLAAIQKAMNIPDSELIAAVRPYAEGRFTNPVDKQKFYDALIKRKQNLLSDFSKYWGDVPGMQSVSPAPPPAGTGFTPQPTPTFVAQQAIQAATAPVGTPQFKKQATTAYKSATKAYTTAQEQAGIAAVQHIQVGKLKLQQVGQLSNDEAKAMFNYQTEVPSDPSLHYKTINTAHYTDPPKTLTPVQQAHVKQMDAAINKFRLKEDMTLYRGIKPGVYAQKIKAAKVGETIPGQGYNSASASLHVSNSFGSGGVVMKIDAKAGQAGFPMGVSGSKTHSSEGEYLLPRGLKFKVKSIDKITTSSGYDIKVVTVDIVK